MQKRLGACAGPTGQAAQEEDSHALSPHQGAVPMAGGCMEASVGEGGVQWSSGLRKAPGKAAHPWLHTGCPERSVAFGARAPGQPQGGFASSAPAPGLRLPGWAQAEAGNLATFSSFLPPPMLS